jgi:sialidase-1
MAKRKKQTSYLTLEYQQFAERLGVFTLLSEGGEIMDLWKKGLSVFLLFGFGLALSQAGPLNPQGKGKSTGPVFEESDLFLAGKGGYFCYRIPALAVSTKGTILAFCEARKNNCWDNAGINIVLRRSFDNGKTWQEMQVIAESGVDTINNPATVVDRETGAIWLTFCKNNQQVFATQSKDDGVTWSKPVEITQQVKDPAWHYVFTGPGHGIQLKSGRLLIPAVGDTTPGPVTWRPLPNWGKVQFSYCFYSDDHGASWKLGDALDSNTSDECEVVETADGRVYMNMRSRPTYTSPQRKHMRAYAWSKDGGVSWSKVKYDARLPEPSCQGSVIGFTDQDRFGKDRVLLANPASATTRMKLTVRVSYDECQTWPVSKVVHEGSSGYSDLAIAPDKTILCLYEEYRTDTAVEYDVGARLILARFNLAWLTNGTDHP